VRDEHPITPLHDYRRIVIDVKDEIVENEFIQK